MKRTLLLMSLSVLAFSCKTNTDKKETSEVAEEAPKDSITTVETAVGTLELPAPFSTQPTSKPSKVVGWPEDTMPEAPEGFTVSRFADELKHPRWTYVAPNGDYFIAESNSSESANQITLLRDTNGDEKIDERHVFLKDLNKNFGMLIIGENFYVANTDGLYRYPYKQGMTKITAKGEKLVDLPAGGYNNHWTRNIITNEAQDKIYISVGSASNVGEHGMDVEERRAAILVVNLDGSGEEIYASGLRNPVGMDWNPATGQLWTAVNERDALGDNLVPDYITSVQKGGWYGWPYSYYGEIKDPRWEEDPHPDMVAKTIIPDVPTGSHTATLGLTFYTENQFPEKYQNGAFIGQHGSWNRANFAGYKVSFVPFNEGKPQKPQDFLTGFIKSDEEGQVYGRPVCVAVTPQGSLLVNDDDTGIIWKVSATK
ncbi:PQQ-dependent sugar dehydrogenase [Galbibacter mesophilus]|uniref:PQQ-dependent sugar dehydrogenase n=1 Tax=Galbibacter mesophilus TaxID=379069 RepID=UPI00191F7261|nr:sorbosone dehydrogenase family protein [Galbibacter mesophilus]MCM5663325.1 sorbosone dehydrogenase family protein [Galbibacter mesophilus]